jgi:hypothetical protein
MKSFMREVLSSLMGRFSCDDAFLRVGFGDGVDAETLRGELRTGDFALSSLNVTRLTIQLQSVWVEQLKYKEEWVGAESTMDTQ